MLRSFFRFTALLLILVSSPTLRADSDETPPGLTPEQIRSIIDTVSGDRAHTHIRHLALHHRWFVSDGYFAAADYVRDQAEASGLQGVRIERFPSDGKLWYSTDKTLPKWTVRSASLRLVEPLSKHLVSWVENPIVLASNSRSADVEAELVDVGEGVQPSDYDGKDVRGRLVLASSPQGEGRIEAVHRLAVLERGAVGVISYRGYSLDDFPDLITWDHLRTLELEGKSSTFGFCITKRMGWELKRLLEKGERVVLHAKVDADLSAGEYGVVTGHIPGTDFSEQEIWFVAHVDHCLPSANDNASGGAGILEAARALHTLYESGTLPRPRRTLRFFWVPEINGTYAYVSRYLEETRRAVAIINMDMVGEHQKLCGSTFRVTGTPDSTPSFFNDLLKANLDFMLAHDIQPNEDFLDPFAVVSPLGARDPWKAEVTPYSGGSDHYVFMGGVLNIPATMLGNWPDYFYHSSGDTPDKSDRTQLKRAVVYGVMLGASVAAMDTEAGNVLLERMYTASLVREREAIDRARTFLEGSSLSGRDRKEALNMIEWAHRREVESLRSVSSLLPDDSGVASRIDELTGELSRHKKSLEESVTQIYGALCRQRGQSAQEIPSFTPEEQAAQKQIPVRNAAFPGPISMDYVTEKLEEKGEQFEDPFAGLERYELGAFINGKRNVLEIRDAVSAECGPVQLSDVAAYLKALESVGLVSFK